MGLLPHAGGVASLELIRAFFQGFHEKQLADKNRLVSCCEPVCTSNMLKNGVDLPQKIRRISYTPTSVFDTAASGLLIYYCKRNSMYVCRLCTTTAVSLDSQHIVYIHTGRETACCSLEERHRGGSSEVNI